MVHLKLYTDLTKYEAAVFGEETPDLTYPCCSVFQDTDGEIHYDIYGMAAKVGRTEIGNEDLKIN